MSEATTRNKLKDTFLTLPVELRIEILAYLGTRHNLTSIKAASPCMLETYTDNEMYIRRTFYKREFTDRMLQDALAIVTFPPNTYGNLDFEHAVIRNHKNQWMSGELPHPFKITRRNDVDHLDSLYYSLDNRIPRYSEDSILGWVAISSDGIQRSLQSLLKSELFQRWFALRWVPGHVDTLIDMEKNVYGTSGYENTLRMVR
ncbi:hypothetical protein FIE12Z_8277 [Fusarium flagelliforme]|uniref:F-box domain-containing protein n=1 Tax=Fusarium flagelliforme TaxID=2675880 RepID=A0A395MHU8_9HYPO|nr:hypothetical protein FIE12Z_8277 [Fusarium flagelliforme]